MTLGIMQPYFFPYLGYFSLIKHVDEFMLFDPVQFIYHGWIERNRILKQTGGWSYISVPLVKHSRDCLIKDIRVDIGQDWQSRLLAQLQHYRKAPHYWSTIRMLKEAIATDSDSIVEVNRHTLQAVCDYLDIHTPITVFSRTGLEIDPVHAPDEWALNICRARGGVDEYRNPPGGMSFFDAKKYEDAGIRLRFQQVHLQEYPQKGDPFEAGLSIIDVLMFNAPEAVSKMLDNFELLDGEEGQPS